MNPYLTTLSREYSLDGKRAIYADLVTVDLEYEEILARSSFKTLLFFEYQETHWHLTQLHCSVYQPGNNTLPIEELWAQKQALEKKLVEKESELDQKRHTLALDKALKSIRMASQTLPKSEDLGLVVQAIYLELNTLGFDILQASVSIFHPEERCIEQWLSPIDAYQEAPFYLKLPSGPWEATSIKDWQEGKDYSFLSIQGELAVQQYARQLDRIMGKDLYERLVKEKVIYTLEQSEAHHQYGNLSILQIRKASEQELEVLKQFAQEFEPIFARFLALKKSKAQQQTRQLEAAQDQILKTVQRMQSSEDFSEPVLSFAQQIKQLGIPVFGVAFSLQLYPEKGTCISYIVDQNQGLSPKISISEEYEIIKFPLAHQAYQKVLAGEQEFSTLLEGEGIQHWISWSQALMGAERALLLKEAEVEQVYFNWFQIHETAIISFSSFMPLDESHCDLIRGLLDPFTQAFYRFLDLQKAKARSQQSVILPALEQVLTRTLAMRQSVELAETAAILFEQIKNLGYETWSCGFCIWQENDTVEAWMEADVGGLLSPIIIPYQEEAIHRQIFEAYQSGQSEYQAIWEGEALENHYTFLKTIPSAKEALDSREASGLSLPDQQYYYVGFFKQGYLLLITTEPNDALIGLVKRFAPILALTYTRFLDLRKAEEQAREAQIEASLERIRTTSMAMQESTDLPQLALTFLNQVEELAIPSLGVNISIINEADKKTKSYYADNTQENYPKELLTTPEYNLEDYEMARRLLDKYEDGAKVVFICLEGEEIQQWIKVVRETSSAERADRLAMAGFQRVYIYFFLFHKISNVAFSYPAPLSETHLALISRLVKTLENSYQRFLDLQKAEAQAREAQIEAAVERVRSEAMAMHHTTDFGKVAQQLHQQVQHLNIEGFTGTAIHLIDEQEFITVWDGSSPGNMSDPAFQIAHYNANEYTYMGQELLQKWKEGESYILFEYDLEKFQSCILEWEDINPDIAQSLKDSLAGGRLKHQWNPCGRLSNGLLSFDLIHPPDEDVQKIILKMTQVFEQAYTRFLDLKKVEAQAQEAEIEAALERLRSRTMGMQKSNELSEVASLLFRELNQLGGELWSCGFVTLENNEAAEGVFHMCTPDGEMEPPLYIPNLGDPCTENMYRAWQKGEVYSQETLSGDAIQEHYQYMLRLPKSGSVFQAVLDSGIAFPDWQQNHGAYFNRGYLLVITLNPFKNTHLLKRFAQVFEQTYTRFLDLKLAEEQAQAIKDERDHLESTLEELRTTQTQLIQSEKLASLGELTAGIAH
ncbi:MAG: hypothetical protein AAFU64_00950, partial [Bacteroidota bacterium]